jgi:hypothetical protein
MSCFILAGALFCEDIMYTQPAALQNKRIQSRCPFDHKGVFSQRFPCEMTTDNEACEQVMGQLAVRHLQTMFGLYPWLHDDLTAEIITRDGHFGS